MRTEEPGIELPEGWEVDTYRFSGNFRLIADFRNEETGAEVRVMPYRSYSDVPGFCDCHRAIIVHPEDGTEEIAVGMEVEHVEEAEEAALEAMRNQ